MTRRQPQHGEGRAKRSPSGNATLDLVALTLAGLRRWYLVLPIVIVAIAVAHQLNERRPPQVEANGQVLLVEAGATATAPVRGVDLDEVAGEFANLAVQGELREGDTELSVRARGRSLELQASGTQEEAVTNSYRRASQWLLDNVERRQEEAGVPVLERFLLQTPGDATPTLTPDGEISMIGVVRLEESAALRQNPHGANRDTVSLLAAIANGGDARSRVAVELGNDTTYQVSFRARDPAPVLAVRITTTSRQSALAAYDVVVDLFEVELASLEERADVPTSARTVIERIAPPQEVEPIGPVMERPVAAVLGLGGLLSVLLVLLLEARDRGRLQPSEEELRRAGLLYPPPDLRVPPRALGGPSVEQQRPSIDGQ